MGKDNNTENVSKINEKLALFKSLKEAGFRTELDSSSVPTVICKSADDMEQTIKDVKKVVKATNYNSSFGVRVMRRGDLNLVDSTEFEENAEAENTEENNTVDFDTKEEIEQQAV